MFCETSTDSQCIDFWINRATLVLARFGLERPLVCVWENDERFEENSAANDSTKHKQGFNSLSVFADAFNIHQKLQRNIIPAFAPAFLLNSHRGEQRHRESSANPEEGDAACFCSRLPVHLRRLRLSTEPGAFTGRFLFPLRKASQLGDYFCFYPFNLFPI